MSTTKVSPHISLFRSHINNRRFDDQTLRILELVLVFKDVESLTEARKELRDFLRSESLNAIREIKSKTVEQKLLILEFYVRAFALLGDIESCLAWRYEALNLRELNSTTHQWLQVSYMEWLNFAEHSLDNGFHTIARKACENALSSIEKNDSADLKKDEFSQLVEVSKKVKRLKDYASTLAASHSVEAQTAKYLRKKTIEKSRSCPSPCKETKCIASNLFRYGIKKRNERKFHELQSIQRISNGSDSIHSEGQYQSFSC
ncbi:hypothetical protein HS088_TW02G00345 [Tripterygium wilfordii]|uniref:Uncharacterized protein n=1 Tax=Tripterygium wilfordii TaxID=458696 RepID=A0A7J7DY70_TRIWF|nr:protein DOUBLE-STRAND BREAK FORMATION [Tripterygium wilfordii]KAF5751332.1 hypothetical protein HS088_TW02G00345 [Tripterygium wilfordii]